MPSFIVKVGLSVTIALLAFPTTLNRIPTNFLQNEKSKSYNLNVLIGESAFVTAASESRQSASLTEKCGIDLDISSASYNANLSHFLYILF